jgi:uncharacterized protein DUF6889
MAPVIAGMCLMESLTDGSLDLEHVALMNDALAVKMDNELLAQEIHNRGH